MRGQIGDEDDVADEFKEDEEHEYERKEADMTFRYHNYAQRYGSLIADPAGLAR